MILSLYIVSYTLLFCTVYYNYYLDIERLSKFHLYYLIVEVGYLLFMGVLIGVLIFLIVDLVVMLLLYKTIVGISLLLSCSMIGFTVYKIIIGRRIEQFKDVLTS